MNPWYCQQQNLQKSEYDFEKNYEIHQKLQDLTSEFYQLIPMKETEHWKV